MTPSQNMPVGRTEEGKPDLLEMLAMDARQAIARYKAAKKQKKEEALNVQS